MATNTIDTLYGPAQLTAASVAGDLIVAQGDATNAINISIYGREVV